MTSRQGTVDIDNSSSLNEILEAGVILFSQDSVKLLIESSSEEIIHKLAIRLSRSIKDSLLVTSTYTLNGFISVLKTRSKMSGFSMTEFQDSNKHRIILNHKMGRNWSLLYKAVYESILRDLCKQFSTYYGKDTVTIDLEKS